MSNDVDGRRASDTKLSDIGTQLSNAVKVAAETLTERDHHFGTIEKLITEYQTSNNLKMIGLEERVDLRMSALEDEQRRNTELTEVNTTMTSDVHEIIVAARSGIAAIAKFGRGLTAIGKWSIKVIKLAGIVAAAGSAVWIFFYTITHDGRPPTP